MDFKCVTYQPESRGPNVLSLNFLLNIINTPLLKSETTFEAPSGSLEAAAWVSGSESVSLSGPPLLVASSLALAQTECDRVRPGELLKLLTLWTVFYFMLPNEFYNDNRDLYIQLYTAATLIYCKWWLRCNVFICYEEKRLKGRSAVWMPVSQHNTFHSPHSLLWSWATFLHNYSKRCIVVALMHDIFLNHFAHVFVQGFIWNIA